MKNRIVSLISLLIIGVNTQFLFAQENPILGNFSLSENNGSVYISWSIIAGNTCDGTRIFRSSDGNNFFQIGELVGICGSATTEESYNFVDPLPEKNTKNYYRLELGLSGFTHTLSIEIVALGDDGFLVWPNPVSNDGKLYFENPKNQSHTLELFNSDGKKAYVTETSERYFQVGTAFLPRGFYVFNISSSEKVNVANGTLVIEE